MLVAATSAAFAMPAHAQQRPCAPRGDFLNFLAAEYGEAPVAMGLTKDGSVLEVVAAGKTWSIIVTMPSGKSCMIVAGESWERLPLAPVGEGS